MLNKPRSCACLQFYSDQKLVLFMFANPKGDLTSIHLE